MREYLNVPDMALILVSTLLVTFAINYVMHATGSSDLAV